MGDKEADIAAINELYDKWVRGMNQDDFELFFSVWADDATRMDPNMPPITGKDKLREHFKPGFDQFIYDCSLYGDSDVGVSGDLAFYRGNYKFGLTPKAGGSTTYFDGKWLDVLKRQPDGSWKVYIDSVSDNVPPKVD